MMETNPKLQVFSNEDLLKEIKYRLNTGDSELGDLLNEYLEKEYGVKLYI